MALDRRKMHFYQGAVETQEQHDKRMAEVRRKYRNSNPGLTLAMMIGLAAGLNAGLPTRFK